MTRVTRPLFGTAATGNIGDLGTFRMGRHGPEFIAIASGTGGHSQAQLRLRACFRAAKAAHSAIVPTQYVFGDNPKYHRVPSWPIFWNQWLVDHPECK